jgi:translation initiation factor 3 subunit D
MAQKFEVPQVVDNPDGWGPSTVPEHLKDVPFAPFGKADKLGRAADWTQSGYQKFQGRYQSGQATAVFNFFANEEEDSFHLVDNRPVKPKTYGGQRNRYQQQRLQQAQQRRDRDAKGEGMPDKMGGKRGQQANAQKKGQFQPYGRDQQRQTQYSSSVEIKPEWAVIEQIPFPSLVKLSCNVGEPKDLQACGELEYYDKVYDRLTVKQETALEKTRRAFRSVTTSDDPVIRELAASDKARVFATDRILTTLMCIKSSVYSWDIVVTRVGDKLFFDKRDQSNLDLLSVNETAPDPIPEDRDNINSVQQLALEATAINQNFSQQVLSKTGDKFKLEQPNPFVSEDNDEPMASCGYKYRSWRLNDEDNLDIVVRCEVDGVINLKGEDQLLSVKALNEYDMRAQDWRKKLESQRGAVLAYETKNNKNKMAKWTAQALLAGVDMLKLGYVSRVTPKDNTNHIILGTQMCKPKEFAAQINLGMEHCWGVVRALVDMLMKLEEGKYLLVKDPNKELLRLYAIPADAFETNYAEDGAMDAEDIPAETLDTPANAGGEEQADE